MARYIVNAGGVVHSVPDETFHIYLATARQAALARTPSPDAALSASGQATVMVPREATQDEIAAYWSKQGLVYDPATGNALTPAEAAARKPVEKPAEKPAPKSAKD